MGDEKGDTELEAAVRRLLSATRDFTRAYEEWSVAPREREDVRKTMLEQAERRLDRARHEVTSAQLRKR